MLANKKYTSVTIFVLCLIFFITLQLLSINPNEQDRFFYFSIDMFQRGPTFFPYVNNQPYPDYIALVMIMSNLFAKLFGSVTVLSIGLPYCIASALLVTFTYKLGSLEDHKLGIIAAFFCLLSWKFLDSVSALDLDLFPALATLFCVFLLRQYSLNQRLFPWWWLNFLWMLSYFCRGPIGLLVPAMISCLYVFTEKQWKTFFLLALNSITLFILSFVFLLLMAYQTKGLPFTYEVLEQQGFGRVVNEHSGRYYFFFTIGLLDYALTSIFALLVASQYLTSFLKMQTKKNLLRFCLQWTFILIIFFTLPATKKARYIMPIVPAIALLSAYAWTNEALAKIKNIIRQILKTFPAIGCLIAIICNFLPQSTLATTLLAISVIILLCQFYYRKKQNDVLLFGLVLVEFITLHLTIIEPLTLHSLNRTSMIPYF